ncbi:Negative regulator of flagellin synthesis [Pontibacillus halophilus JSM 076056 = DSM 19796]|uniref:Negative regulator of flagellin synthesis n=1 Tax=Pontibacillus halophilus JSM 076056 = DSM 19796 TaxID=1385510 RepID=A0A0A5IDM7_9BACI|nr:flagellar biosynthesis anti-sigma factor FlgM [Pontibacillus halophilus]KGX93947.1 Negative regulator of flagellin synthesis [Pontibacillus halophilus JSM 076056 = DSM 19796]
MKINGPQHSNLNPYQKQFQKQAQVQKGEAAKDRVEISSQAKHMQEASNAKQARLDRVEELKNQVQSGTYQVDAKETAKNVANFFKGQA